MRIVVAHSAGALNDRTRARAQELHCLAPSVVFWDVSESDQSYTELFCRLVEDGEDFVLIEQDILPEVAQVKAIIGCPRRWCSYSYPVSEGGSPVDGCLGLTRYRRSLLKEAQAHPPLTHELRTIEDGGIPAGVWWRLDARVMNGLRRRGFAPHNHGLVTHLHDYSLGSGPDYGLKMRALRPQL